MDNVKLVDYIVASIRVDGERLIDSLRALDSQIKVNQVVGRYKDGTVKLSSYQEAAEYTLRGVYRSFEYCTYGIYDLMEQWGLERDEDLYYKVIAQEITEMMYYIGMVTDLMNGSTGEDMDHE